MPIEHKSYASSVGLTPKVPAHSFWKSLISLTVPFSKHWVREQVALNIAKQTLLNFYNNQVIKKARCYTKGLSLAGLTPKELFFFNYFVFSRFEERLMKLLNQETYSLTNCNEFEKALHDLPCEIGINTIINSIQRLSFNPSRVVSVGSKKCPRGQSCFMNGICVTLEEGIKTAKVLSDFQGKSKIDLIYNSTFGLQKDLVKQQCIEKGFCIPAAQILKSYILNYFKKSSKDQLLHLNVHSQGGSILKTILSDIPPEFRNRMLIDTYGTAAYIDKKMAKQVRNFWHINDNISKLGDRKGWEKARREGTLYIIKNDGKSFIDAHTILGGYRGVIKHNMQSFSNRGF